VFFEAFVFGIHIRDFDAEIHHAAVERALVSRGFHKPELHRFIVRVF
jgi:hypothetical protein